MNDKFSADLRQHLLRTANERPADRQLDAIVERVAVTPQRHPLAARLTWAPDRIGPFPSEALRYGLIAAALLAMTGLVWAVGSQRPASTVFEGTWTTTDAADGSTMFFVVGAGIAPDVRFVDEFATGFACREDAVKVFTADGTGTIDRSRLEMTFPNGGGCGLETVGVPVGILTHDAQADTLVDSDGLTWTRVPEGVVAPTPVPVPTGVLPTP